MATRALPPAPTADAGRPYDGDTYGWSLDQAAHLRAGRFDLLDIEHLADEIESVGKSEYRELESALRVVLLHLLKWRFQPERRGRPWRLSIAEHRDRAEQALRDNPSLKPRLGEAIARAYRSARREAAIKTGLRLGAFPAEPPFTLAEILEVGFDEDEDSD
jgi:hypothetical protein